MVAIITGDIINSDRYAASEWMDILKPYLASQGKTPNDWEIYRGDEFQIRTTPERALSMAIQIKALIKSIKNLDVRIGIGLGSETFVGSSVSQSNGKAYQRSGRVFETLKEQKLNLAIVTGHDDKDKTLNLMLKLALNFMDDWSVVSAQMVSLTLTKPNASQQEVADQLKIRQSAVSQRLKRARMDLVLDLLAYYRENLKDIKV
ncbi:SatD family protein [Arenibacter palladensis]|uniref:SatD family protein n=1 Tax=Arenibacter palladensis TaxID=237373 RepID=UPI0026E3C2BD|nr:SatD family protein [Arenibacter palladensis]MDO6604725.1 SatD family protein [Arenibacter palladensis]|tara:strand:- start:3767 stop:4378 length:612 start_codon:yes stop_codon:yes gene_type:complete